MTGMLASVTSVAEAKIVLDEGVDIVDLKNPDDGALGALNTNIVRNIVNEINGFVTTSATIGDIDPDFPGLKEKIFQMSATGIDIVKVGLFGEIPTQHFIDSISKASAKNIDLVVVIFAENFIGDVSYKSLLQSGVKGIMLDTRDKADWNLRALLNDQVLENFIQNVKAAGLLTGLAGSLRFEDINALLKFEADYLGFRGALCSEEKRINQIDLFKIKKIRNAIPQHKNINYDLKKDKQEVLRNGAVA